MTWITHTFFAFASASVLGLPVLSAVLGSTAPDWLEDFLGIREHRGITHYVVLWVFAGVVAFFVWLWLRHDVLLHAVAFVYGGLTHLLLDSLTVAGVPLGVGRVRVRIAGLIRTGKLSEWVFLAVLVFAFSPFLLGGAKLGWGKAWELYNQGVIDKREYLERRFKLF